LLILVFDFEDHGFMKLQRALPLMCTLAFLGAGVAPSQEAKIEMTPVKYAALKDEVLKHRGKVVLVDFWAGY
jgi:hypothetical protein